MATIDNLERVDFNIQSGDDVTSALTKLDNNTPVLATAIDNAGTAATAASNAAAAAQATATAALPKAGGTMTGTLTAAKQVNGLNAGGFDSPMGATSAAGGIHITCATANVNASPMISFEHNGVYAVNFGLQAGVNQMGYGGWSVGANIAYTLFDSGHGCIPNTDNAYALGSPNNRFTIVYAAAGVSTTSDERIKTLIGKSDLGLDFINSLNPVAYTLNVGEVEIEEVPTGETTDSGTVDADGKPILTPIYKQVQTNRVGIRHHYGLFAQEVAAALTAAGKNPAEIALWMLDDANDPDSRQSLRYSELISPLIKAVQELTARVVALESKSSAPAA